MYKKYIKRLLDIVGASILLVFLSPVLLFLIFIIMIKLGRPIFFTQPRPGKNEKIFNLIKFRSMNNKKNSSGDLLPDNERLTKFGLFLRKSSLDELPELWNILRGDMSFIGPRPLSIYYLPSYSSTERKRHSVRPGLSGWAQVSGRNNVAWNDRLAYDLEYVERISLLFDFRIIIYTIFKVLNQSDVAVRSSNSLKNLNVLRKVEEETFIGELNMNVREIGSDFEFVPIKKNISKISLFDKLTISDMSDYQFTFSGRSAISEVLDDAQIDKKFRVVYAPSYACISMLQPFIDRNISILYYDVKLNNNGMFFDIDKTIIPDFFLFMEYFGNEKTTNDIRDYLNKIKSLGTVLIKDITHNLFNESRFDEYSDYYIASIRKWCAIPSGGIAYKKSGKFLNKTYLPSEDAVIEKLEAMRLKKSYLDNKSLAKTEYLRKFADFNNSLIRVHQKLKIDNHSLSYLKNTELENILEPRLKNTKFIIDNLETNDDLDFLVDETTLRKNIPLFIPLKVNIKNRDKLRDFLIKNEIYLPVHWPEEFGQDASIKKVELSLVCDQRYTEEDMKRMVDLLNNWKEG